MFIAAIAARDIHAMDKIWAQEPYAAFIGPLSTNVVIGWEGVRKAWEMRFSQFDKVTISSGESHVHTIRKVAWAVGVEKIELLRKDGTTLSFDTFSPAGEDRNDQRAAIEGPPFQPQSPRFDEIDSGDFVALSE